MKKNVYALGLATTLISGCGQNPDNVSPQTSKIGEEVCTRYLNILSNDPNNPNTQIFHSKGLIYPILTDCSRTVATTAKIEAKVNFGRSESIKIPTTGSTIASTVNDSKEQIKIIVAQMNKPASIGVNVKPYVTSKHTPNIQIVSGEIEGNASAEGRVHGGDRSLLLINNPDNTPIARERAIKVKEDLLLALKETGAIVDGESKIKIKAKNNPLTEEEIGLLYAQGLKRYGNGENVVMEGIKEYNTTGMINPLHDKIIGEKRYAKAYLQYTATGVDREIKVSHLNYLYWLAIFSMLVGTTRYTLKGRKK